MTVVERAEKEAILMRRAAGLVDDLRANASERERLISQRDDNCSELRAAGASIKELEEVFGISRARVQQILRDTEY